jgi:hypothetical protein
MIPALTFLERSWAAVFFEVNATPEQLEALRPTYQAAWEARKAGLKQALQNRDRQAFIDAVKKAQADLEAKLREVLTAEQMVQLKQWEETQRRLMGRAGGGR